jgi:hypothetical protein
MPGPATPKAARPNCVQVRPMPWPPGCGARHCLESRAALSLRREAWRDSRRCQAPVVRSPARRCGCPCGSARTPKAPRPRPSRQRAPAPRSAIRVRPGARLTRTPRALTRPRWPVSAKPLSKTLVQNLSQPPGRHQRRTVGDSSWRGQGRNWPEGPRGDTSQEESPTGPSSGQAGTPAPAQRIQ